MKSRQRQRKGGRQNLISWIMFSNEMPGKPGLMRRQTSFGHNCCLRDSVSQSRSANTGPQVCGVYVCVLGEVSSRV